MTTGEQQRINNVRKSDPVKLDCPAQVQVRDILVFSDFEVSGALNEHLNLPSLKGPTNHATYVSQRMKTSA